MSIGCQIGTISTNKLNQFANYDWKLLTWSHLCTYTCQGLAIPNV